MQGHWLLEKPIARNYTQFTFFIMFFGVQFFPNFLHWLHAIVK